MLAEQEGEEEPAAPVAEGKATVAEAVATEALGDCDGKTREAAAEEDCRRLGVKFTLAVPSTLAVSVALLTVGRGVRLLVGVSCPAKDGVECMDGVLVRENNAETEPQRVACAEAVRVCMKDSVGEEAPVGLSNTVVVWDALGEGDAEAQEEEVAEMLAAEELLGEAEMVFAAAVPDPEKEGDSVAEEDGMEDALPSILLAVGEDEPVKVGEALWLRVATAVALAAGLPLPSRTLALGVREEVAVPVALKQAVAVYEVEAVEESVLLDVPPVAVGEPLLDPVPVAVWVPVGVCVELPVGVMEAVLVGLSVPEILEEVLRVPLEDTVELKEAWGDSVPVAVEVPEVVPVDERLAAPLADDVPVAVPEDVDVIVHDDVAVAVADAVEVAVAVSLPPEALPQQDRRARNIRCIMIVRGAGARAAALAPLTPLIGAPCINLSALLPLLNVIMDGLLKALYGMVKSFAHRDGTKCFEFNFSKKKKTLALPGGPAGAGQTFVVR